MNDEIPSCDHDVSPANGRISTAGLVQPTTPGGSPARYYGAPTRDAGARFQVRWPHNDSPDSPHQPDHATEDRISPIGHHRSSINSSASTRDNDREALRQRDRAERNAERAANDEQRASRRIGFGLFQRRRAPQRTRVVGSRNVTTHEHRAQLSKRRESNLDQQREHQRQRNMQPRAQPARPKSKRDVDTQRVKSQWGDIVGGVFTLFYVVALPYILFHAWSSVHQLSHALALEFVFACLVVLWLWLIVRVCIDVIRRRSGVNVALAVGGVGWLAAVIVMILSLSTNAGALSSSQKNSVPEPTTYVVEPGDSLWSIAQQQLGNGHEWSKIFELNQVATPTTSAVTDPSLIRPGWRLHIPPIVTSGHQTTHVGVPPAPRRVMTQLPPTTATSPTSHEPTATSSTPTSLHRGSGERTPWSVASLGALPFAMVAKRRRDFLQQSRFEVHDDDVDAVTDELRLFDEVSLKNLQQLIPGDPNGIVAWSPVDQPEENSVFHDDVLAVAFGENATNVVVAFARPGGTLPFSANAARVLLSNAAAAMHIEGTFKTVETEREALRGLALRTSPHEIVVYLGCTSDLDQEIAEHCVTLTEEPMNVQEAFSWQLQAWTPLPVLATASLKIKTTRPSPSVASDESFGIRVELLRAEPSIVGLVEAFTPTLRRRCVEMTAYLAVHRREPVTGERLRVRVLAKGNDDASVRMLSNTATAVRRSLGMKNGSPRLHAVTAAGRYETHDLGSDLEQFHALVARAKSDGDVDVLSTLRDALELIKGEPMACALRGFEWFLSEGHLARLQRESEWAGLALAHEASERGDVNLAFWAIEQARLCDPHNDVLIEALNQTPRLREFGRDGTGRAKNNSVSTDRAVAMSWSFESLSNEVIK